MPTLEIPIHRFSVVSTRPFEEVVARLTATIGRPDMNAFQKEMSAATSLEELETTVRGAVGPSELMEFARYNSGAVLCKARGRPGPRILRLVVGNPLIMKDMVETAPDAAAYAPVTLLIDERADGVHLSYDTMASLIAPYGSETALAVARDLDAKIVQLFETTTNQGASS
jgi:hypothetical protein